MGSVGPTHRTDADSDPREYIPTADSPFYCFSTPVTLVVSPVFPRCTGVCVFVPCGILRAPCPSEWSRERSAPSSVARVCRLTPLCTRTTLCRLSLLHHRRRWVSLTYHANPACPIPTGRQLKPKLSLLPSSVPMCYEREYSAVGGPRMYMYRCGVAAGSTFGQESS